jgi:hypothetical protein
VAETSAKAASSRRERSSANSRISRSRKPRVDTTTQVITDYQSRQVRDSTSGSLMTTVVTVSKARPLENPPPTDSPWGEVEKERLRREWSARQLSSKAGLNPTHYAQISNRNGWETTELATLNRFRVAVELPPIASLGHLPRDAGPDGGGSVLHQIRKQAIMILVREGIDLDEASEVVDQLRGFEPARGPGQQDPDPARLAHFARKLLEGKGELGSLPGADLGLDTPAGKNRRKR